MQLKTSCPRLKIKTVLKPTSLINILPPTSTITTTVMFQSRIANYTKTRRSYLLATSARQCAVRCAPACIRGIPRHFSKINSLKPIIPMSSKHRRKHFSKWEPSTPQEMCFSTKTRSYLRQRMSQAVQRKKQVKAHCFQTTNRMDPWKHLNLTFKYMLEMKMSPRRECRSSSSRTFWTRSKSTKTR